jgi:hypothetical protein
MRGLTVRRARSRRVLAVVSLAVLVSVAAVVARVQTSSAAVTTLQTFSTPGAYTWTVPAGVTNVTFDVFGASGGNLLKVTRLGMQVVSSGGAGGEAKAKFKVRAGQVFEIVVGGQGGNAVLNETVGTGGFNGGGDGSELYGGGGGGGSDVRLGGRGNPCVSTQTCGYSDRIIVGGGGGGAEGYAGYDGDAGGGLAGGGVTCGSSSGVSATQECAGQTNLHNCPNSAGGFGTGGGSCPGSPFGGGGGGLWGGASYAVGGGGSGYVSPFSTSGSFPGGTNTGDGKVIITTTT